MDKYHAPGHRLLVSEQSQPLSANKLSPFLLSGAKGIRSDILGMASLENIWRWGQLTRGDAGCAACKRLTAPRSTGIGQMFSLQKNMPRLDASLSPRCKNVRASGLPAGRRKEETENSRRRLNLAPQASWKEETKT